MKAVELAEALTKAIEVSGTHLEVQFFTPAWERFRITGWDLELTRVTVYISADPPAPEERPVTALTADKLYRFAEATAFLLLNALEKEEFCAQHGFSPPPKN